MKTKVRMDLTSEEFRTLDDVLVPLATTGNARANIFLRKLYDAVTNQGKKDWITDQIKALENLRNGG